MQTASDRSEERHAFRQMSKLQWLTTLATLLAVMVLTFVSPIEVDVDGFTLNHLFGTVFGTVGLFYTYARFDVRVAAICDTVAQLALFILIGGIASYLAAYYGAASVFIDHRLLAFDQSLGFDWRAFLAFMSAHPNLAALLNFAYLSIIWQAIALVAVLAATHRHARLQAFTFAFQLSALACVVGSALLPALGVYSYLDIDAAAHRGIDLPTLDHYVPTLMQLRGSTPHLPTGIIEGIVTFPSLHMALAVLFIWGFWGVPILRWFALVLNGLMIVATPLSGSHYLADLAAGAMMAVLALFLAIWARDRHYAPARGRAVDPFGAAEPAIA